MQIFGVFCCLDEKWNQRAATKMLPNKFEWVVVVVAMHDRGRSVLCGSSTRLSVRMTSALTAACVTEWVRVTAPTPNHFARSFRLFGRRCQFGPHNHSSQLFPTPTMDTEIVQQQSSRQSLLRVTVLGLAWLAGFCSRLFAVIRFESIIHEFDPWYGFLLKWQLVFPD